MTLAIILLPATIGTMALVFVVGGMYIAVEETMEDSMAAELVDENHHGMAFGVLATVNGIGDFISSIFVGVLWSAFGTTIAFGYSAALFFVGALLMWSVGTARISPSIAVTQ